MLQNSRFRVVTISELLRENKQEGVKISANTIQSFKVLEAFLWFLLIDSLCFISSKKYLLVSSNFFLFKSKAKA